MVNDLMLLLISWRNEVDDAALAQEAQFAAEARRAGAPPRARPQVAEALQPTTELANIATMQGRPADDTKPTYV